MAKSWMAKNSLFDSQQKEEISVFSKCWDWIWGPTNSIQWVPRSLYPSPTPRLKQLKRKGDHAPSPSSQVKLNLHSSLCYDSTHMDAITFIFITVSNISWVLSSFTSMPCITLQHWFYKFFYQWTKISFQHYNITEQTQVQYCQP